MGTGAGVHNARRPRDAKPEGQKVLRVAIGSNCRLQSKSPGWIVIVGISTWHVKGLEKFGFSHTTAGQGEPTFFECKMGCDFVQHTVILCTVCARKEQRGAE